MIWRLPACIVVLLPAAAGAQEYVNIYRPLRSSAVMLVPLGEGKASQGTGWLVDRENRLVVTNWHVLNGQGIGHAIFPVYHPSQAGLARADRGWYLSEAPQIACRRLASRESCDLAILQLENDPGVPELPLARAPAQPGQRVYFVSNQANSDRLWVSAAGNVDQIAEQKFDYGDSRQHVKARICAVRTEKALARGASGAPVVNENSEVVAVTCGADAPVSTEILAVDLSELKGLLNDTYRGLATSSLSAGKYPEAVGYCNRALDLDPRDALALNERGAAWSFQDRFDDAVADFTASLEINPRSAIAYRNRGSAWHHLGEHEKAIADCSRALRLRPGFVGALEVRARAHAALGDEARARADLDEAARLRRSPRK